MNVALLCAHLFLLFNAYLLAHTATRTKIVLYFIGYLLLFLLVYVIQDSPLIFTLFVFVYAAVYRITWLVILFILFVCSFMLLSPFSVPAFILLSFLYFIFYHVWIKKRSYFYITLFVFSSVLMIIILFPILNLVHQDTPQTLLTTISEPAVRNAIGVSLITATIATLLIILFGIPLAFILTRVQFPYKPIIDRLIDIPILIPQSVIGITLCVLLAEKTPIGEFTEKWLNIRITGSLLGIIIAQFFTSCPFLIRAAEEGFRGANPRLESIARTLGATPYSSFFRVSLPLAYPAILSGSILAWSRAISQFGAVMIFSYHPLSAPVLLYDRFNQYGLTDARPIAICLILLCCVIFISLELTRLYPVKKLIKPFGGDYYHNIRTTL